MGLIFIPLFILFVAGISAFLISRRIMKSLAREESVATTLIGMFVFMLCLVLIGGGLFLLFVSNLDFHR